jgi:hypothetical protein
MTPDDPFKRPFPDENYVPPNEADLRKQALQRAYEIAQSITTEQARVAEEAERKPPTDWGPVIRLTNAALAIAVAVWLIVAPPTWLPQAVRDARTIEQREMSLRLVLALEASRITAFRDEAGRLPESINEAGGDPRNVTYAVVDATRFTLTANDGASSLSYDSTQPLGALLGGPGAQP